VHIFEVSIYDASEAWSTIRVVSGLCLVELYRKLKQLPFHVSYYRHFGSPRAIETYLRSACLDVLFCIGANLPCVILNDTVRSQTPSKVLYWNDNE